MTMITSDVDLEDSESKKTLPPDPINYLLCEICGEWVDRRDLERIYDHLEHHTGAVRD